MFRIGQKVVCIDDEFNPRGVKGGTSLPKRNEVYTIRELMTYSHWVCVRLSEIVNPSGSYLNEDTGEAVEAAFPAWRFRPIVERKTDISIFVEILRRESMPDECAPAAVYGVDWGASA